MEKKSLGVVAIALVLIGAGWGVHWLTSRPSEKAETGATANNVKIVDVNEVVNNPEMFKDFIGVKGTIAHVDERSLAFTLGCEDACIEMPVKFNGQLPKEGTNVIAYGEVKKTEQAKYVFIAQEVEAK
ncbi:MAG: hypothetical protein KGJ59_01295 [Bacteroidota bacterium]|nr:hypothetical protein [Bacteroidota bacterium]